MKKVLLTSLLLPLTAVLLSGCVMYNGKDKDGNPIGGSTSEPTSAPTTSEPTSEPTSGDTSDGEPTSTPTSAPTSLPEGSVNVYLNLGVTGLYEGAKGEAIESQYVEYGKALQLQIGSALPGKDKVTSTVTGSQFDYWVVRGTQNVVTTVPAEDCVLIAIFNGGGGGQQDVTPTDALPSEGYGLMFKSGVYLYASPVDEFEGFTQYLVDISKYPNFKKDDQFQLFDFASQVGWTKKINPASIGGEWDQYISWSEGADYYTVLQDFTAKDVYIKMKFGEDELYLNKA